MRVLPGARLAVIALLLSILIPASAGATSMAQMSLEDLAASSPVLVYGTVVSATPRWNADHTLIVTEVRMRVETALKGLAPDEIVFVQPGGAVGKLQVDVPGASAFRPGEEAVLFLAPDPAGTLHVIGLDRGRFDVVRDARTGRKLVQGLTPDRLVSLGLDAAPPGVLAAAGAPEPVTLDRFLGGLRDLVRDAGEKGGN